MNHHAFYLVGNNIEGIETARAFASKYIDANKGEESDITVLRYSLFSVEDARKITAMAYRRPVGSNRKALIICVDRIFHEAQNALLKVFEEPPEDVVLILIVPALGSLIPTLRSRLLPLAWAGEDSVSAVSAKEFLNATSAGREKIVEKILTSAKSDSVDTKQKAYKDALMLIEGLLLISYEKQKVNRDTELDAFMSDLQTFIPLLHERSSPLKLILEHVVLVVPKSLGSV